MVVKAYADTVQISGHDGGTGASPLSSIKHAGLPWEVGLADAQHTLMANGLRGRVKLRVDGGLKTGRDVVIGALLGAEEFGFGTAPLVAAGCVMARQCHANTCPVGVATQREDLRARFPGTPEHVVAFMYFVAEHVRHILADMGVRSLAEIIGKTELLERRHNLPRRAASVDLSLLLATPGQGPRTQETSRNDRPESEPVDRFIAEKLADAVTNATPTDLHFQIDNRDRSLGAALSGRIAYIWGEQGLPPETIRLYFKGQAGQSFGAFCHHGMRLDLTGEAQDYVGKSMAGGTIVIRPTDPSGPRHDVLMGNTVAYGATGGQLYVAGKGGERLAVRNSGATIVVEGCGDHGCEYMTGGTVVVLGPVGHNFAAGMSGGRAFVYDPEDNFLTHFNGGMARAVRVSEEHRDELHALISAHVEATGSVYASAIAASFDPAAFWLIT
jgi:glutamate synthase domain-containing protein 3